MRLKTLQKIIGDEGSIIPMESGYHLFFTLDNGCHEDLSTDCIPLKDVVKVWRNKEENCWNIRFRVDNCAEIMTITSSGHIYIILIP